MRKHFLFLSIVITTLLQLPLSAQNYLTEPYSFTHKLKKKVTAIKLDAGKAYKKFLAEKNPFKQNNFYLGQYDTDAEMNMQQHGTWEQLPNGDRIWRLKLCANSKILTGIGIHADKTINIPDGGKLFFYSDDRKYVVGPITEPNVKNAKQLLINTIPGKNIWVEYYEPSSQKDKSVFNIDAILYRFVEYPYSFAHPLSKEVPFIDLVPRHRTETAKEDIKQLTVGELAGLSTGGIFKNCFEMGVWEDLPNGDRIWRMGFESDIAFGMDFNLNMKIPEKAYLTFYSADKMYISSVFDKPNNNISNTLGTGVMPGNRYIMEYYEPKEYKNSKETILKIMWLEYDLTKWVSLGATNRGPESEVACSPNITCDCDDFSYDSNTTNDAFCGTTLPIMSGISLDPNFTPKLKRSVVRFQLFSPCINQNDPNCTPSPVDPSIMVYNPALSKYYASGALINNVNNRTFVLSANHVLKPPIAWTSIVSPNYVGDDLHWIIDFNFETTCNNFLLPTTFVPDRLNDGLIARAGNSHSTTDLTDYEEQSSSDFLLLELNKPVPINFNPHYAGWDASTQNLPLTGLSISHPIGFDKRMAVQDDAINLITANPNNGIKAFSGGNSSAEYLAAINENTNGEQFAITFDRGATLPGSSGSPYFNPDGRIIGDLGGGSVECDLSNPSFPNGNNNKVEKYGRLWYYYDSYPQGNLMGGPKINVSSPTSPDGTNINNYEKTRTLKWWLPDNDGIMDGLAVNNCDLYLKDCTADIGTEPSACTSPIVGTNIVASPDLWNNRVNIFNPLDIIGNTHEMPDFMDSDGNHLDNYLSFNVRNPNSCTSAPATLHLYWAMASTGLNWPNSWQNHDVGIGSNTCIVGNEIGVDCYANEIHPYQVPALNPGQTYSDDICWLPPNFTDPNADALYYPYQNPNLCDNLQAQGSISTLQPRFAISLLARLVSLDNPISNEQQGSIMPNVRNNNNITLRNTFLADIGAPPQIIWVTGTGNINVVLGGIRGLIGGDPEELQGLLNVELLPGAELWDKWASTGFKGEGIEIISDGIVKITNLDIAKLLDIPFEEGAEEPLAVRVTVINSSGKSSNYAQIPNKYDFAIWHEPTNPTGYEPESSPCLFEVNDILQYLAPQTPTDFAHIKLQPNPFNTATQIVFELYQNSYINLQIYDLQGRLVQSIYKNQYFEQGTYTYTLSEPNFANGIYSVVLQTEKGAKSQKLVKLM